MEISSNVWHLRLVNRIWFSHYEPVNLCRHFWAVVAYIGWVILILSAVLGLLSSFGWAIYQLVLLIQETPREALTGGGMVLVPVAVILSVIFLVRRRKARPAKPYREPSLFGAWIKAKKARVCPIIIVREDGV